MTHNMIKMPLLFSISFITVLIMHTSQNRYIWANSNESASSWRTEHPRLYFSQERIDPFKEKLSHDEEIKKAWKNIKERADKYVDEQLVSLDYAESGSGQHGNYGRPSNQMSRMGANLGLAYQITGEEKYAEKLRKAMLHFSQLNRWAGDADRDPPWHSELNTARFCFGYGVGYDSIHDYLSESDREIIVDAMVRLGILPTLNDWVLAEKRIHALDSMGHNWWSVCVSMAGVASLSILGEHPDAETWVEQVRDSFPEWFAYQGNLLQNKSPNFDRHGAFYESVVYANYALSEYLLFHLAYSNSFSESSRPQIPLLNKSGDFFIHTAYPTSDSLLSVNFGDGSLNSHGAKTLQLLKATGFDKPEYSWYLTQTNWGLNDPIGLVYQDVQPTETPPESLSTSMLYPDIGWCTMRNSWEEDATMLAMKSGFTWNHAHPDAGSFILFQGGKPLIIDSGNCSYSRREYSSYYRHSKAHNVILFDGEGQNPEDVARGDRGVTHPGKMLHLMDSAGIKYALADVSGPTSWKCSRNYRHFLWIDDVILIFDDIRTHETHQLEWLLHYEGEATEEGDTVHLSNGEQSRAQVQFLYPKEKEFIKKIGLKDHEPDTETEYLAVTPEEKTRAAKFITAILPYHKSKKPTTKVQLLEGDEMLGVKMVKDEKTTEVFLNLRADGRRMHRNSNKVIQGWDTDAYLFGLTYPSNQPDEIDSIQRGFVICGSYLRNEQQVLLDSLSKVYSIFSWDDQTLDVILEGQPIINCSIYSPNQSLQPSLNGENVSPQWNEIGNKFQISKPPFSDSQ